MSEVRCALCHKVIPGFHNTSRSRWLLMCDACAELGKGQDQDQARLAQRRAEGTAVGPTGGLEPYEIGGHPAVSAGDAVRRMSPEGDG